MVPVSFATQLDKEQERFVRVPVRGVDWNQVWPELLVLQVELALAATQRLLEVHERLVASNGVATRDVQVTPASVVRKNWAAESLPPMSITAHEFGAKQETASTAEDIVGDARATTLAEVELNRQSKSPSMDEPKIMQPSFQQEDPWKVGEFAWGRSSDAQLVPFDT